MKRRHIEDQSSQTLISDEDGTGLMQSDKRKTPESGLSVWSLSRSSTVNGIGQAQTSSNSTGSNLGRPRTVRDVAAGRSSKTKKLKATASMATWLRIGSWEKKEIYDGDVVGRCYYCSQKLAWEVTEDGWKSKIEFGWSKIIGMQTIVDDDDSVILNLELNEPPMFYVEERVFKAKKQGTWLKSADFTEACQASTFRRHSIRFKPGVFVEVYADLLSSDARLFALTQKPFPTLNSPFFDVSPTELSNGNPFSAAAHSVPFFPISSPSLHPSNLTQSPPQINQQLRFSSPSLHPSNLTQLPPEINQQLQFSSPFLHPSNLTQLPPQINQQLRFSSPSLHPSNLTQLPPQINQQLRFSSPSLYPSNLTQWPPQINQQLLFSSPSSSQLAPLLQPNQYFPISSSFPTNLTPLPLQPIPPFDQWPIDDASIESSYWRNELGSSTNLTPLLPPLRMSLSNPDNLAPSPLQINQQHLMNQHLHQITNPLFHPTSENVLPKQTVGSSSSTTVLPDEMIDIDWLLGGEEDTTNVVPSSGDLWDVVKRTQYRGHSSDQQHFPNNCS